MEWRQDTNDPLLDPEKVAKLEAEIDACKSDGKPSKDLLKLSYREYFFD